MYQICSNGNVESFLGIVKNEEKKIDRYFGVWQSKSNKTDQKKNQYLLFSCPVESASAKSVSPSGAKFGRERNSLRFPRPCSEFSLVLSVVRLLAYSTLYPLALRPSKANFASLFEKGKKNQY